MLDHLISKAAADYMPEVEDEATGFTPLDKTNAPETLKAQLGTAEWLQQIAKEDEAILNHAQQERVSEAFTALVAQTPDAQDKLLTLKLPEEVMSSVAMLGQYQWKFVEQADELRSMAVAKIVKETDHPDARIRLKALDMLGKVTEVGLFTERIEVKKTDMTNEELDAKIKEKLSKYMGKADVVDVDPIENDE